MIEIFLKIVPFFLLIGTGYGAARSGLFRGEAVAHLTKFVFYFALSAMLFNFASTLPFEQIFNPELALAYLYATGIVYVLVTIVALRRGTGFAEAAVEAQCGVIGNVGFLGLPMLVILLGPMAAGPVMMMLAVDLIVFGSLIVAIIVASREGRLRLSVFASVAMGLVKNPMIMSIAVGLLWSYLALPIPGAGQEFLDLLGGAATPCALFAIGASLADKSAERFSVALWLSSAKLILHPLAVAIFAILVFQLPGPIVAVMIASAAMPVAGNIFIIAQHYGVAPMRVSSAILVSTVISIVTLSLAIGLVS
ncbi:AEC family transporter [Oceanibium sediminis]|uniref:AEC family transporter n=1 Tax=Oceanibium sediminis TaxID=2026339 RepID=UPI000DD48BC8|nr:AEC family transporter [Oceanibium sediminis]